MLSKTAYFQRVESEIFMIFQRKFYDLQRKNFK